MQQHPGALQVLEKPDPQPRPVGGALDQSRNISHYEATVLTDVDHPEIRVQRGERVVRHLRPRRRYGTNQSGFSSVRKPQQAHIRDDLHLELERAFFAGESWPELPGRAIPARFELLIS